MPGGNDEGLESEEGGLPAPLRGARQEDQAHEA